MHLYKIQHACNISSLLLFILSLFLVSLNLVGHSTQKFESFISFYTISKLSLIVFMNCFFSQALYVAPKLVLALNYYGRFLLEIRLRYYVRVVIYGNIYLILRRKKKRTSLEYNNLEKMSKYTLQ